MLVKVQDSSGKGLSARVVVKLPQCVPGAPDNTAQYFSEDETVKIGTNKGTAEFNNLPFGTYEVTARFDGKKQTQMVTISDTTQKNVTFTF